MCSKCSVVNYHTVLLAFALTVSPTASPKSSEKRASSRRVASEARVEEPFSIREARAVGKGKLHLIFVGVADRDYSVARPHRASHPFPFLDYLPVGLKDALADAGERFATPVCESCDQLVNTFRWIHWILCLQFCSPRKKPSKEMAFPHPKSRKEQYRKKDIPNSGGVIWSVRR